jgi:hypothetical protein
MTYYGFLLSFYKKSCLAVCIEPVAVFFIWMESNRVLQFVLSWLLFSSFGWSLSRPIGSVLLVSPRAFVLKLKS